MEKFKEVNEFLFNYGGITLLKDLINQITGYELVHGIVSKNKRGVYIIVSTSINQKEIKIEYIGSSQDIYKRLYIGSHDAFDKIIEKSKNTDGYLYSVFCIETNKYLDVEKTLIQSLRPHLNKTYNK